MYTIKELVQHGNYVLFTKYFDGQLWYEVYSAFGVSLAFEFPVPVSDIGTATFLPKDKAILFMRYIRKHLEMIQKAKEE